MDIHLDNNSHKYYNQDIFAKAGIKTLSSICHNSKDPFNELFMAKSSLLKNNSDNMSLVNSINFFLQNLPKQDINEKGREKEYSIYKKFEEANKEISKLGSKKIKPGCSVFIHSLNNQIFEILKHASRYKNFEINILEHSPFNFSHTLHKHLNKANITIYPDISIRQAIHDSDICFIGADAILKNSNLVAKIGSTAACMLAKENNVPVYVCAHSWKYDSKNMMIMSLQKEHEHDVKHHVKKIYEIVNKDLIQSFICETGIFNPKHIIDEIRFANSWMFLS